MEKNQIIWKSAPEIKKAQANYELFVNAFNEAIDNLEKKFSIKLREGDVKQLFIHWKNPKPFRVDLANYLWNYGSSRIGMSVDELEEKIKHELASFTRSVLSIYYIDPKFIEFADCRIVVKEIDLNNYLVENYSVALNSDTRQKVWQLAQQACDILNELERVAVEGTKPDLWFKIHATTAHVNGGRAIIDYAEGEYRPIPEEVDCLV